METTHSRRSPVAAAAPLKAGSPARVASRPSPSQSALTDVGSSPELAEHSVADIAAPPGVMEVVELFRQRQPQLRFPGIDAAALSDAVEQLADASKAVAAAQLQLDAARRTRTEAEAQLLSACKRAYAYARLFAEDDATLAAELAGFRFAQPEKGRAKAPANSSKGQRTKRSATRPDADHEASAADPL